MSVLRWLATLLVVVLLLSKPPPASAQEGTSDRLLRYATLEVSDVAPIWLDRQVVVEEGPLRVVLDSGYFVPVVSSPRGGVPKGVSAEAAEPVMVGFVWVDGTGSAALRFPDPGDAMAFGNRMVLHGGMEKELLQPVVRGGQPFEVKVERAVVLCGQGCLQRLVKEFFADDGDLFDADAVVVIGARRDAALARLEAAALLTDRRLRWRDAGWRIPEYLADQRLDRELYGVSREGVALLDLRTDVQLPVVVGVDREVMSFDDDEADDNPLDPTRTTADTRVQRTPWLTLARSDMGGLDPRARRMVTALVGQGWGRVHVGLLATEPFPPSDPNDPTSLPLPVARVEVVRADATLRAEPSRSDARMLRVEVKTALEVRAVGGSLAVIGLQVPRGELRAGRSVDVAVYDAAGVDRVVRLPDWRHEQVAVALERPLRAGETVTLTVVANQWIPVGNALEADVNESMGRATGPWSFLPFPSSSYHGGRFPFTATASWPSDLGMAIALSGDTVKEVGEGSVHSLEVAVGAPGAVMPMYAVGRWHRRNEAAYEGYPAVRVHLLNGYDQWLRTFGPEVRRDIVFFEKFLPTFPVSEMDVVEVAAAPGGFTWIAPHGMIVLSRALMTDDGTDSRMMRRNAPNLESEVLAHEAAHQYWGHQAWYGNPRDQWIAEALASGYACMYLAAAFEKEACKVRTTAWKRTWERDVHDTRLNASVTRSHLSAELRRVRYEYAPYVLFEVLQRQIGTEPFFAALDGVLMQWPGEPLTTERLQAAFEITSGQDLGHFFDFWIHGGHRPGLTLWHQNTRTEAGWHAEVRVVSDVPFGVFDTVLRARNPEGGVAEYPIHVVDGEGVWTGDFPWKKAPKWSVDPWGVLIATERRTRREAVAAVGGAGGPDAAQ